MQTAIEQDLIGQLVELGHQVRSTREFRKLTQPQVAMSAGIGLQTYLRIEAGHAGIGAVNLGKVMRILDMEESLVPGAMPPDADAALHERHLDSADADQAIEDAVKAACESLDAFFDAKHPEVDGIGSNFQGLLKAHVAAMLCGAHSAKQRYATFLPRLLYSDEFVGGPRWEATRNHGWVLRVRGTNRVLNDLHVVPITHSSMDPFSSREYALEGFRKFVEKAGHPPGPVDAVPVYLGADEKYRFQEV